MRTAQFINFTDKEFVGYWNGKGRKYPSGASEYMPDYLAKHFAKHLVNRELLRTTPDGTLVHKDGDKMTSPKFPEQIPLFMELFGNAYIPDEADDLGSTEDGLDALIGAANKNRQDRTAKVETAKIESVPPLSHPENQNRKRTKNSRANDRTQAHQPCKQFFLPTGMRVMRVNPNLTTP